MNQNWELHKNCISFLHKCIRGRPAEKPKDGSQVTEENGLSPHVIDWLSPSTVFGRKLILKPGKTLIMSQTLPMHKLILLA